MCETYNIIVTFDVQAWIQHTKEMSCISTYTVRGFTPSMNFSIPDFDASES